MEQNLTAQSYIVRLYRVDTEDNQKITGFVESLDGSGRQAAFRNADELAGFLNSGTCTSRNKCGKPREGAKHRRRLPGTIKKDHP